MEQKDVADVVEVCAKHEKVQMMRECAHFRQCVAEREGSESFAQNIMRLFVEIMTAP